MEAYLRIYGATDTPLKIKIKNPLEARDAIGIFRASGTTLRIGRVGILKVTNAELSTRDTVIYNCEMAGIIGDHGACQYCGFEGCEACYKPDMPRRCSITII
jgi:hypothetical protein